jgi:hypothetical protein
LGFEIPNPSVIVLGGGEFVVGFGLDVIGVELRVPALAGGDFE